MTGQTLSRVLPGFQLDDEDRALFEAHRWGMRKDGYVYRTVTLYPGHRTKTIYFHRESVCAIAGEDVDHINGDPRDNRRLNLRKLPHAHNLQNRKRGYGISGVRGVVPTKAGTWRARAEVAGREQRIGTFPTLEEAAAAVSAWRLANAPGALS